MVSWSEATQSVEVCILLVSEMDKRCMVTIAAVVVGGVYKISTEQNSSRVVMKQMGEKVDVMCLIHCRLCGS